MVKKKLCVIIPRMAVSFDLFSLLSIAGIGGSAVLGILLLTIARGNRKANVFFFLFILANSFAIFSAGFSLFSGLYKTIPHTIGLSYIFLLTLAPLLNFYYNSLTVADYRLRLSSLIHALPMVLFLLINHRFYLQSGYEKILFVQNWLAGYMSFPDKFIGYSLMVPFLFQATLYLISILKKNSRINKAIRDNFSETSQRKVNWGFQFLILSLLVLALFIAALTLTALGVWTAQQPFRIISLLIPGYLLLFSFNVFRQPDIRKSISEIGDQKNQPNRTSYSPYGNLTSIIIDKDLQSLKTLVEEKKIYRDPDLSLNDLAEKLSLPRGTLSWLINNRVGKNFYDYINDYRLEEVLERIDQQNTPNIMELAFAAGFKTKSTFYKLFRERTGINPGQYKKSNPSA